MYECACGQSFDSVEELREHLIGAHSWVWVHGILEPPREQEYQHCIYCGAALARDSEGNTLGVQLVGETGQSGIWINMPGMKKWIGFSNQWLCGMYHLKQYLSSTQL